MKYCIIECKLNINMNMNIKIQSKFTALRATVPLLAVVLQKLLFLIYHLTAYNMSV